MKKVEVPAPVAAAAERFVSSFGEGVYLLGRLNGFEVYTYSPKSEPEIGAVRFLYKKGEDVETIVGLDALRLELDVKY